MMSTRGVARAAAVAALVLLAAGAAQAINIATVPVGNVGNPADPTTGFGSVAYSYNIGTYEVTAGQYTAFLNAVAATDTYALYNPSMWSDTRYGCQIQQSGVSGSYFYSVSSAFVNRPVNYVSFWDSCRFANWLNNGQGGEGTTEYGAYSMTSLGIANNTIIRNAGCQWAVTSENEWYKAAYYNTATGTYNLYATSGNSISTSMANYDNSVGHPTDVGSYPYSSPYGTFDQGGDVSEWTEAITWGNDRLPRGGSFSSFAMQLQSTNREDDGEYPANEYGGFGFRVSAVPEPATLSLLALGGLAILGWRRAAKR